MAYDPDAHHRRSIRLPGFDYSGGGTFFVTICVDDRECLFGDVIAANPAHWNSDPDNPQVWRRR